MFRDHKCYICCENLHEKFQKKKIAPRMNFTEIVQWNYQEKKHLHRFQVKISSLSKVKCIKYDFVKWSTDEKFHVNASFSQELNKLWRIF